MIRETFIRKYIWSQDHKVIAIQYALVAIGIGLVALVMSVLMRLQLSFPTRSRSSRRRCTRYITMHGMIMVIYLLTALFLGGFGNYLIPLMCGSQDMVFPYMNMLSFWFYLLAVLVLVAGLFVPGGPTRQAGRCIRRRRSRQARRDTAGHHLHARLARHLRRRLHDGRPQLRHHDLASALQGHDHRCACRCRCGASSWRRSSACSPSPRCSCRA